MYQMKSPYDKREDFNFHITNFPLQSNNIPASHSIYDMRGLAPRLDVLFWGRYDFQISFSDRDTPLKEF